MNEDFDRSLNRFQRKLTSFMANELTLDYVENLLNSEDQEVFTEYLKNSPLLQDRLVAIEKGRKYCEVLSQIQPSKEYLNRISQAKIGWALVAEKLTWSHWPEMARWSVEALVVALTVAILLPLLPLKKISRWLPNPVQEIILAEIQRPKVDLGQKSEGDSVAVQLSQTHFEEIEAQGHAQKPFDDPIEKQFRSTKSEVPIQREQEKGSEPESGKGNKFVYRVFMQTSDLEAVTEKIKQQVSSLEGKKAGQVELGWHKDNGSYFHFSMPEINYEKLLAALREIGPVRIYKDPHKRVMPVGQIRFILVLEEKQKE
ncbi:MAG: hypothetical protein K1X29_00680 [Bdellovibrionales bacterium]|nr:hypothetical protein [Bdellovibrionales bacterium]